MRIEEPTIGKLPRVTKPTKCRVTFNMHKPNPVGGGRWQETRFVDAQSNVDLQRQANKLLAGEIADLWAGSAEDIPQSAGPTVVEYAFGAYIKNHIQPSGRVNSEANVRSFIKAHLAVYFGERLVSSIVRDDYVAFQAFLRDNMKGRSGGAAKPAAISTGWKRFVAFCNSAIDDGLLVRPDGKQPKGPIEVRVAAKEKVESWGDDAMESFVRLTPELLQSWEGRASLAAFYTGLRLGELLALEWADVRWPNEELVVEHGSVYLTAAQAAKRGLKGPLVVEAPIKSADGDGRRIPIHGALEELLRRQHREQMSSRGSTLVFPGPDGAYSHQKPLTQWFDRFCRAHELPDIHFHSLRHCYATLLLTRFGVDYETLRRLMGHSKIETTIHYYAHLTRGALDNLKARYNAWSGNLLEEVSIAQAQ